MKISQRYDVVGNAAPLVIEGIAQFLRADPADTVIDDMVQAAVVYAENFTNTTIRETAFMGHFPCFVETSNEMSFLLLERHPVNSVTSVSIVDPDGVSQAVSLAQINLINQVSHALVTVELPPEVSSTAILPITAGFAAGYASSSVPGDLKRALMHHVAFMYQNRGDVKGDFEDGVPDLSAAVYRRYRIVPGFA